MLAVLVLHYDSLTASNPASIGGKLLVHHDLIQTNKVAHAGVSAALLRLLIGTLHEAHFVCVLAGIGADTLTFEGAEDVRGTIFLAQVFLVRVEGVARAVQLIPGCFQAVVCICDRLGLGSLGFCGSVCQNAVLHKHNAEVAQFLVDPGLEGTW